MMKRMRHPIGPAGQHARIGELKTSYVYMRTYSYIMIAYNGPMTDQDASSTQQRRVHLSIITYLLTHRIVSNA